MPDGNTQDNREQANAEAMPSLEYILENWINVNDAAEIMRVKSGTVRDLCAAKRIRSKKIGRQWYVDPHAAHSHKKGQHRRDN